MNKKLAIVIVIVSAVFVVCAITVAASSGTYSPLYMIRMQQASDKMHFSPATMSGFTYNTEPGCTVGYYAAARCGAELLNTAPGETFCDTCPPECYTFEGTCMGSYTCCITCFFETCWITCETCEGQGYTCDDTSCQDTCVGTCDEPTCSYTCPETCDDPTCFETCERTCRYTCEKPCIP